MGGSHILFHNKNFHPFVHNILVVFFYESLRYFFVFCWQWFDAIFVAHFDVNKFTILYNKFKYAFTIGIIHMYVDRFVFSRKEKERKTEIFIYFWHNLLNYFRLQRYILFPNRPNFISRGSFLREPVDSADSSVPRLPSGVTKRLCLRHIVTPTIGNLLDNYWEPIG